MTLEAAKPKHRYVALDSLRGVCACMVVLLHAHTQAHFSNLPLIRNGFLFVDFFFVLSGFVIGSSYGDRLRDGFSIGRFMWLRLWRVYPLHLVMLLIFLAFEIAFAMFAPNAAARIPFSEGYSPAVWFYSLFLVQIFVGPEGTPWNGPSWSIAAEVWTYLIFAVVLRYLPRLLLLPICVAFMAAALIIIPTLTDRYMLVFHDGALLRCLFGFSLGIVGWHLMPLWDKVTLGGRLVATLIEIGAVAGVSILVAIAGSGPLSMITPFIFFVAVMVFARQAGMVSTLLLQPPFVLLGTLSYSIYMIHVFLLYRFVNVLSVVEKVTGFDVVATNAEGNSGIGGGAWFGDAITVIFLGGVILCSYISYRLIELPGQRFGRNWGKREAIEPAMAPGAP